MTASENLRSTIETLGALPRLATPNEMSLAIGVIVFGGISGAVCFVDLLAGLISLAAWFLVAALTFIVLSDSILTRDRLVEAHTAVERMAAKRESGAPRIAEVTCSCGIPERFLYDNGEWHPYGPAVNQRGRHRAREATTT